MCVLLNILDEVAPGAYLTPHIEKLSHHRHPEVRISKQFVKRSLITTFFVLALNRRKFCPENQQGTHDRNHTQHQIRHYHPQRLGAEIRSVKVLCLQRINLFSAQLDAGKNENRSDQYSRDRTEGVKRLGKI